MKRAYGRVNDGVIRVKTIAEVESEQQYSYGFLIRQREAIIAQRDRELAQREAELDEVEELIKACERRGIIRDVLENPRDRAPGTPIAIPRPALPWYTRAWLALNKPRGYTR